MASLMGGCPMSRGLNTMSDQERSQLLSKYEQLVGSGFHARSSNAELFEARQDFGGASTASS